MSDPAPRDFLNERMEQLRKQKLDVSVPKEPQEDGTEMAGPTREELDAKLAAAEARTETRFVELNSKIDRLTDLVTTSVGQLTREVREVKADNKNTRWTIGVTVVVTIVAALAALWTTQNNLIAAFSTGVALHESLKASTPPK